MSTAIIDLNDSAILCRHGDVSITVPGYALLTKQGVTTGQEALQKAWLLPQQSHNQYWHQLGLSPLPGANRHARHHADLAYAQLQELYHQVDKPEQIIFAMPGNVTVDQLSILLGLAKASPFRGAGLVDSAVAAVCQAAVKGPVVHVDMQLHTTVITRLECDDLVSRQHATQHPDIALKAYYDTWAHFIADQFIREYRYDPMHTAAGEQQLRDLLPGWLMQLDDTDQIEIELSAKQGNFRLNILRSELINANSQRWQRLASAIAREQNVETVLLSQRVSSLPGAAEYLDHNGIIATDAAVTTCLAHTEHIVSSSDKLAFITALPALAKSDTTQRSPGNKGSTDYKGSTHSNAPKKDIDKTSPTKNPVTSVRPPTSGISDRPLPTHVLYRHRAYGIYPQLNITIGQNELQISDLPGATPGGEKTHYQLTIAIEAGKVMLGGGLSNLSIHSSGDLHNLLSGDSITVQGETLAFIEVL